MNAAEYARYLQSERWKNLREIYCHSKIPKRRMGQIVCEVCELAGPLDLHHLTYERRGRELLEDLCLVCRRCHQFIHRAVANGERLDRTTIMLIPKLHERSRHHRHTHIKPKTIFKPSNEPLTLQSVRDKLRSLHPGGLGSGT